MQQYNVETILTLLLNKCQIILSQITDLKVLLTIFKRNYNVYNNNGYF